MLERPRRLAGILIVTHALALIVGAAGVAFADMGSTANDGNVWTQAGD